MNIQSVVQLALFTLTFANVQGCTLDPSPGSIDSNIVERNATPSQSPSGRQAETPYKLAYSETDSNGNPIEWVVGFFGGIGYFIKEAGNIQFGPFPTQQDAIDGFHALVNQMRYHGVETLGEYLKNVPAGQYVLLLLKARNSSTGFFTYPTQALCEADKIEECGRGGDICFCVPSPKFGRNIRH
jgi:hypothetical protein